MSPGRGLDTEPISFYTSSQTGGQVSRSASLEVYVVEAVLNYFFAAAFFAGAFFAAFLATSV